MGKLKQMFILLSNNCRIKYATMKYKIKIGRKQSYSYHLRKLIGYVLYQLVALHVEVGLFGPSEFYDFILPHFLFLKNKP